MRIAAVQELKILCSWCSIAYVRARVPANACLPAYQFSARRGAELNATKAAFVLIIHSGAKSHSQMEHYFFSHLLTWEVDLIEIIDIMAKTWHYVIFLSLKPTKVTSDFILY